MAVDRTDEQFALAVVGKLLGVEVEEYDIGTRQNAVDARLHYPDGRIAALEVSSIGPMEEARIAGAVGTRDARRVSIPGLTKSWIASLPRDLHPRDLVLVTEAVRHADAIGLESLDFGWHEAKIRPALELGISAHASGKKTEPVLHYVLAPIGGFTGRAADTIQGEIDEVLRAPKMRSKLDKLSATGWPECHLYLYVRPTALSFNVYDTIAFGGDLPTTPARLPAGLDQLWLVSGWKAGGVVRAITHEGWRRDKPFD